MATIISNKLDSANNRLNPSRFNDRYFILKSLRNTISSIVQTYLSINRKMLIVDFGCGSMPYRPIFEPYVFEYIGVDLPNNLDANSYTSMDSKTELPTDLADVVLSTQVLEHVNSPTCYLQECYRILKPNGVLILSTHGYWPYHPGPSDLWRWTSSGLSKIVKEAGFYVVEVKGLMALAPTAIQLFQDAVRSKVPRFTKPLLVFCIQSLISILDRFCSQGERNRDACVLMVVALKKEVEHLATEDC